MKKIINIALMLFVGVVTIFAKNTPTIISSEIRKTDPTIIDVVYKVTSDKETVNVRALAFEDGERSFAKVVRPETFVKDADGNETAQNIGDNIAANVEHKLSWKVSSDWATDLAKVKFEILVSDMGQLPLDVITIPAAGNNQEMKVSYNSQTDTDIYNALMWYYACVEEDLTIKDLYLYNGKDQLTNGSKLNNRLYACNYVFKKMGYEGVSGELLGYTQKSTRRNISFNTSSSQNAIKSKDLSGSIYVGENAYCVIDISGGTSAAKYPVTYLDSFPVEGWSDEYKTTKILLRRIEAGTVKLGNTKPVTLTKPYYIGVFEITQKQYQLVMGSNPSYYKGDMRPVEKVSWNDIRGNSSTHNWPSVTTVDSNTFIGKLQAKTGLNFDLPTEAQWEYACRAGTTSDFNNGGKTDADLSMLGRYSYNKTDGRGGYIEHTTVGSYMANAWGLYDMHGNVYEWCLDWYDSLNIDNVNDWVGPSAGSRRVRRGGSWNSSSNYARSSYRSYSDPSYRNNYDYGFRISRTLAE